jgi:hypothetical protein
MNERRFIAFGLLLVSGFFTIGLLARSQQAQPGIPELAGVFTGRRCVTGNSEVCPEINPESASELLTARAKAFANAFDELAVPKYDCAPTSLPTLFGDPYAFEVDQRTDRLTFIYEKDDVVRTVWLDGHGHQDPAVGAFFVHGYSTGRYEGDQLVVETTKFAFDPTGIAGDFIKAPSSTQKRLIERYSREGDILRMDLRVEDPIFLLEPITYIMEWRPSDQALSLPWACNAEAAQRNLKLVPSKYPQDPPVNRRN